MSWSSPSLLLRAPIWQLLLSVLLGLAAAVPWGLALAQTTNTPPAGYTLCAAERAQCSFTGTANVVYGSGTRWTAPRKFTSSVTCNNATFGDPTPMVVKSCYYAPAVADTPPAGYTRCASEGAMCTFSGLSDVIYGSGTKWSTPRAYTGSVTCNNATFGDPTPMVAKSCYYRSAVADTPPAGYTRCATEGGQCAFSGQANVVYGARSSWSAPRSFTGGVACRTASFGVDPTPFVVKSCHYQAQTAAEMGAVAASRLLTQATFGPSLPEIEATAKKTYDQWIAEQASMPPSLGSPLVAGGSRPWDPVWWTHAVRAPDQLRQRMAFALSEIFVIGVAADGATGVPAHIAAYYDILTRHALGNYRQLLEQVTLSPEMGLFLNMWKNDKPNLQTGVRADQNYAREVMQLFSVGLVRLNLDGTIQKDARGNAIPTYGQAEVEAMANVFTGWASKPVSHSGEAAWEYDQNYIDFMVPYENHHDTSEKRIIAGAIVPAGGTAAQDLKIALDTLFNHPNVGPFIGKQLIQRLVTSNPSPAYVQRVASVFNNNGSGVRGDLLAVAKAIVTDPEATSPAGSNKDGKLREPILRMTHLWRAFDARDSGGGINEYDIVNQADAYLGQKPMNSPTVFNFFVPDYQRAGRLTTAGLLAPEFQITDEYSLVVANNQIQRQAYKFIDSGGTRFFSPLGYSEVGTLNSNSVLLQTKDWEPFAGDPAQLVDKLNLVFMQGKMPAAMRATLMDYINSIPSSEPGYRAKRAVEAAELIINSPQYAVQR